jgi:hypothetical protein
MAGNTMKSLPLLVFNTFMNRLARKQVGALITLETVINKKYSFHVGANESKA